MPDPQMFHGDGRAKENPHDYKKNLMLKFMGKNLSDAEKIEALGLGMASGSTADSWFDEAAQKALTTWAAMSAAFDTKWPKRAALKRTGQDAIEDLLGEKLAAAEIGKRVADGGGEEFGHVVWARKMVRIASDIPDPRVSSSASCARSYRRSCKTCWGRGPFLRIGGRSRRPWLE
jgi:hypothetical protein